MVLNKPFFVYIYAIIILYLACIYGCVPSPQIENLDKPGETDPGEIKWYKSLTEASELANKQNKPLMLVFYGVSSKRLDDRVFSVKEIIKLSQEFVCLKLGASQKVLIDKYKVQEFPTIIFTDSNGGEYDRFSGYRSWQSFSEILKTALIPVEIEYNVQMNVPTLATANVECVFKNIRQKSLVLGMRERHDRVSNLSYVSNIGQIGWEEVEKNVWIMKFNSEGMKTARISYAVPLNLMSKLSYQPEYASYVGDNYGVLDGRGLFLEPQGINTTSKVKVYLKLPSGWDAITPWDIVNDNTLFLSNSIEEVVDSVFCIGKYQFAKRTLGEHEIIVVYCGSDKNSINLEKRADEIIRIFNDYVTRFGDFPFKRYMAVFTDRTKDGRYITGSSAHVVGFAGFVNVGYSFIAHEIFHVWNGGVINQKSDYEGWFKEGFTQFYGYLTPYRVGLYGKEEFFQYINRDYRDYIKRYEENEDIPLARVKEDLARKEGHLQPDSIKLRTMYNKGALVANVMNEEIKKRTGNLESLDSLMKYMFQQFRSKRYSSEDILEAVNKITNQDFSKFFTNYIYGTAKLPLYLEDQNG